MFKFSLFLESAWIADIDSNNFLNNGSVKKKETSADLTHRTFGKSRKTFPWLSSSSSESTRGSHLVWLEDVQHNPTHPGTTSHTGTPGRVQTGAGVMIVDEVSGMSIYTAISSAELNSSPRSCETMVLSIYTHFGPLRFFFCLRDEIGSTVLGFHGKCPWILQSMGNIPTMWVSTWSVCAPEAYGWIPRLQSIESTKHTLLKPPILVGKHVHIFPL